jgi:Protein of unknown function (DUF3606)
MRRSRPQPVRNKIDLADPAQIRVWTRRWGISADDLARMVGKVGNSIAAVSKQIDRRKALPLEPVPPVQIAPTAFPAVQATPDVKPAPTPDN